MTDAQITTMQATMNDMLQRQDVADARVTNGDSAIQTNLGQIDTRLAEADRRHQELMTAMNAMNARMVAMMATPAHQVPAHQVPVPATPPTPGMPPGLPASQGGPPDPWYQASQFLS